MANLVKKSGAAANTIFGVLLVLAILISINIISTNTFVRLDLTEDKEFTISDASRDMLGELEDLVTITVYMSENLPSQLSTLRRQISDILDEYNNYSHGRVQVDFIAPEGDAELEQKLRSMGIPQVTAQIVEKDQFQSIQIYLGLAITYLDKQEIIPVIQDTYTLEYDLTSAIIKVSQDKDYVIGVLSGPTVHDLDTGLTGLQELIQKQHTIRTVTIGEGEQDIPDDIDLLLIAGPENVNDMIEYRIDQYLMRGGKIVFLIDAIKLAQSGGLQANPLSSGIEDLLACYGVRVQNALTLDPRSNATASFSSGYVRYSLPYPYWPQAGANQMNNVNPVTNRLESVVLPWAAPIELDVPNSEGDPIGSIREREKAEREARKQLAQRLGMEIGDEPASDDSGADAASLEAQKATRFPETTASVLVRTSGQSWKVAGYYDLNPQQRFAPPSINETSSQITAVALTGRFSSFFANRAAPVPSSASSDQPLEMPVDLVQDEAGNIINSNESETLAPAETETPIPLSPETQILVVGNAQFITDSFLAQFPGNSLFIQNTIDWLTMGDRLISIRSRGATDRPLKELSPGVMKTIKLLCILGTSVLIIAFGLFRMVLRRKTAAEREALARVQ